MAEKTDHFIGTKLGNYTLERLLGRGGMGAVYLAQQQLPARKVAVKILQPPGSTDSEHYIQFLQRFRREANIIARLEHVNITPIYEYGEQEHFAYLVMPYFSGGSLRDLLAREGHLSLNTVLTYGNQAASALDYAHAQGILHRDLKPSNLLLHADGRLVLADFGIARILQDQPGTMPALTTTGMLPGTPEYMAPEMMLGEEVSHLADIYEFGIVLFQLLSGRLPYPGTTLYALAMSHVQQPLPSLHQLRPEIPQVYDEILQKACAKQREVRYQSAQALMRELHQAAISPGTFKLVEPPTEISAHNAEAPAFSNASAQPVPPPFAAPEVQQPPVQAQWQPQPESASHWPNNRQDTPAIYAPYAVGNRQTQPHPYTPHPPAYYPPQATRRRSSWTIALTMVIILLLLGGSVVFAQQLLTRNSTASSPTATSVSGYTTATTSREAQYTPSTTSTSAPATTTPGTSQVPHGARLYRATGVGQSCDHNGGAWSDYNGVGITCSGNQTVIRNTASTAQLQGTFLSKIQGQAYTSNYVVEAQLQQANTSSSDFGLYFRNQPGQQQGVYTLLVHPDGTWNTYVYDNNTGAPTRLAGGNLGDAHAAILLAVIANGQSFTFYANGHKLGEITNTTYAQGTAGIAVDKGASITAQSFTLYQV
ncbi:serine/threonine protein kinase [Ktedonobacter racemifer]|uniref:non-specific serine/threonine protein kinase n=1 Tax=Ktedonobacter racemifer DSM 44963 TaxID=485913 RepID=D6TEP8_KTERA|nr:serine/threonine-protein kinase [Ktedonobacter racemifer]EFH88497.1 serine/threonine protein kinase [Ktedonobacter racemifer DSM 44963]